MIKFFHILYDKLGFMSLGGSEKYDTKFTASSFYTKIYILSFCMLCFLMILVCWPFIKTSPNSPTITFIVFAVAIILPIMQHAYLQYKGFAEEVFAKYNEMTEEYRAKSKCHWVLTGMLPYCLFPIVVVIILCIVNALFY